jgi:hypothetical protein
MVTLAEGKGNGKEFVSHAPGFWPDVAPELWNDWKWQLKNRVTSLAQLDQCNHFPQYWIVWFV